MDGKKPFILVPIVDGSLIAFWRCPPGKFEFKLLKPLTLDDANLEWWADFAAAVYTLNEKKLFKAVK